jgi:hypothetical protein
MDGNISKSGSQSSRRWFFWKIYIFFIKHCQPKFPQGRKIGHIFKGSCESKNKLMKDEIHSYSIFSNMVCFLNEEQHSIYDDIMYRKWINSSESLCMF